MAINCPKCQTENSSDSQFCKKCATPLLSREEHHHSATETLETPKEGFKSGATIAGRYQIIEELGKGGMGTVYKVLDRKLSEEVALKLLNPEISSKKETLERFRNEVKLARKIIHKNVGRIYHLGEEGNNHFITMEYIPGQDLKGLINQTSQLTVEKAIAIAEQACEGLAEAHKLGIVHRDLKPSNIMIDQEGNARIMDFGIAQSSVTKGITEAHVIVGTPDYMSPEQVEGEDVDQRSDIYSFGVILYEMLTGKVPFEGKTPMSVAVKHLTVLPREPKELNSRIPEAINRIIMKCMQKDKDKRFHDAEQLLSEITKLKTAFPFRKRIPGRKKHLVIPINLKRAFLPILAVLILLGGYLLWREMNKPSILYDHFVLVNIFAEEQSDIQKNLIEFLFQRMLAASTKLNIFVQKDFVTYKKRTETANAPFRNPIITLQAEIHPKITGFTIFLAVNNREKTHSEIFECKGYLDFISNTLEKIHSSISEKSEGLIGEIENKRTISQITSDNYDALNHFIKGEEAWDKLEINTARSEYKTAIENSPDFSLAHVKLGEVLLFQGDRDEAEEHLRTALTKNQGLIEYDFHKLKALMARIDSKASEERYHIGFLTEAFPLKKEYHYDLAESYFHYGEVEEAIKHYKRALELDPYYSLALNHIAFCYSWLGNHQQAEECFEKYVKLDNTANSYDSLAAGYMFAGNYNDAFEAIQKGKELDPGLEYLYSTLCSNFILKGQLKWAADAIQHQVNITKREITKVNAYFYTALIELMRGKIDKSWDELRNALDFFRSEKYRNRIEESPNRPFWLMGVLAAKSGDREILKNMLDVMEKKISQKNVNATNYFPIYKQYIHLLMLDAYLQRDIDTILKNIDEVKRIKNKLGYWNSMFNLSYFYNEYAEILMKLGMTEKAQELLLEVTTYNPNYAASRLNLAEIYLDSSDMEKAQNEFSIAKKLLADADDDYILVKKMENIGNKITNLF